MKKTPLSHKSATKPAFFGNLSNISWLGWTLLINFCLFMGLYLFFRTDITNHLLDNPIKLTKKASNQTELVAKNIPLSSPSPELISQSIPNLAHSASSANDVTQTDTPNALPTLLEPTVASQLSASNMPITMTKIVRFPQKMSNNDAETDKTRSNISTPQSRQNNPATTTTSSLNSKQTVIISDADQLLTDHDLPSQSHPAVPKTHKNQTQQQQDLEAKTVQLSEAINQVKRLNQQAIDKANIHTDIEK